MNPGARTVRIYRLPTAALGSTSILTDADTITGEDVLPGFTCPVRGFFA